MSKKIAFGGLGVQIVQALLARSIPEEAQFVQQLVAQFTR
jgi:hypothetical protein